MERQRSSATAVFVCALLIVAMPGLYVAGYFWHEDQSNNPLVIDRLFRYQWLARIYWPAARAEEYFRDTEVYVYWPDEEGNWLSIPPDR